MDVEEIVPLEMSENIQLIADWMRNEVPFNGRTDPSFIITFLSFCSNDVEKTKQRIARYYELRKLHPKLMTNRDVLDVKIKKIFNQGFALSDGWQMKSELPVVISVQMSRLESEDDFADAVRVLLIGGEFTLRHNARLGKHGCVCVFDMKDLIFSHVMQFTPSLAFNLFKCITEGIPVQLKAAHFINVNYVIRAAIKVTTIILPSEFENLIHVHSGGWECLSGRVPAECLPVEYGGTNGNIQDNIENCWNVAIKWREYLLDDEKYGYSNND